MDIHMNCIKKALKISPDVTWALCSHWVRTLSNNVFLFTTIISATNAFKQNSNDYCVIKENARKLFSQHWNNLLPYHPEFSNLDFNNEKGRETI